MKKIVLAAALSMTLIEPALAQATMEPAAVAAPASVFPNPTFTISLIALILLAMAAANA